MVWKANRRCRCKPKRRIAEENHHAAHPGPGRPGISSLQKVPKGYRPSENMKDFETRIDAETERNLRIRRLAKCAHQGDWGDAARCLRCRLLQEDGRTSWPTLASPTYCRHLRQVVIGNLHKVLDQNWPGKCVFVTLVRNDWARHPGDLHDVDLDSWKRALRKSITDRLKGDSGWIFLWFEASYDPVHQCYQFHAHGIATGDYVDAVEALNGSRAFRPWANLRGIPDCSKPVDCEPVQLEDLPRPIAYSLKSFWKLRNSGWKVRLDGDEHTRMLLFLDEHRPEDFCLMIGISVRDGRFVIRDE